MKHPETRIRLVIGFYALLACLYGFGVVSEACKAQQAEINTK